MGRGRPPKRPRPGFKVGNSLGMGSPSAIATDSKVRKRYSKTVCETALKNSHFKTYSQLPGVNLRPMDLENDAFHATEQSSNDIIDLNLQQNSYKQAHAAHKKYCLQRKSTKHIPTLVMKKVSNQGFGVTVQYSCQNCGFSSEKYNLFATTTSGACVTNVQSGVAFSKSLGLQGF